METPSTTTDLSIERSRMAAERTLMAWIRTSLSMISFGFTIFKFFQYMQQSGETTALAPSGAFHMGRALVVLGTLLLVPATIQHWLYIRHLKKEARTKLPFSLALLVAGMISLLGLIAMANLFFKVVPF